jgi:hypothetical protein
MAWADKEMQLSDNQLLDGLKQVWSTNTYGSNSLRDFGRGKPLWANLTIKQKGTNTGSLLRCAIRMHNLPTPPNETVAFAFGRIGDAQARPVDSLFVGSRLSFPIYPTAPYLAAGSDPWNHPSLGQKYISALFESTELLDENALDANFANWRVSLDISLQPTTGFQANDQQYYPSGYRA